MSRSVQVKTLKGENFSIEVAEQASVRSFRFCASSDMFRLIVALLSSVFSPKLSDLDNCILYTVLCTAQGSVTAVWHSQYYTDITIGW